MDGHAAILVISPLKSIILDQLREMETLGYPAMDCSDLSAAEIRRCNFLNSSNSSKWLPG